MVELLDRHDYVADRRLATSVFLALTMRRPMFLEGEAGVGKTELAKVLATALGRKPCASSATKGSTSGRRRTNGTTRGTDQIRLAESAGRVDRDALSHDILAPRFLLKRPLLAALAPDDGVAPVPLIDELDRTDEPFEAYLLEVLAEFDHDSRAAVRSRRASRRWSSSRRTARARSTTRSSAAVLYHWVGYPDALTELAIVRRKCPQAGESLARAIVAFTQRLRAMDLFKAPGIAETLDWAEALVALDRVALDPQTVADTAGVLLKYQDDVGALSPDVVAKIVAEVETEGIRL